MRAAAVLILASLLAPLAHAQQGLRLEPDTHLQARVQLLASENLAGSRLLGAQLLGDYYLIGQGQGLRLSGGLLMGPASLRASGAVPTGHGSLGMSVRRLVGSTEESSLSQPYLGMGYSHQGSEWRFSADLGVAVAGSLRLGGSQSAFSQSLDESLRRLQLTPLLQLSFSYRF